MFLDLGHFDDNIPLCFSSYSFIQNLDEQDSPR